jgi:nucleotide-binding universal stress UspA family protein
MFEHILLPTDGSPAAEAAVDAGIALARQAGAKVTALHVMPVLHMFTFEPDVTESIHELVRNERAKHAKSYLALVEQRAAAAGVTCQSMLVVSDHPYQAIIDAARTQHCDLIVLASHGRKGIKALLLGSETLKVLTHSAIPVLVFREAAGTAHAPFLS